MKVAIVTPTIGGEHFSQCLESVQKQTYENLVHYVFLDGKEHYDKIHPVLYEKSGRRTIKTVELEDNVGKDWLGHRVYAACSFLVNADVICYLDEDNWIDSNHVQSLIDKIKSGYDWAYCLRKIHDKNGKYLFDDNCESLGKWPIFFNDQAYHIDTSSFGIKRDIAIAIGHSWYDKARPKAADRQFFQTLKHYFPNFDCTNEYTLNYRLGGNPNSVTSDFFIEGNKKNFEKYKGIWPWTKKESSKIHVGPGITVIG